MALLQFFRATVRGGVRCRGCCTSVLRDNTEEAPVHCSDKAFRRYKNHVLRRNRRDPEMEKKARMQNRTCVCLWGKWSLCVWGGIIPLPCIVFVPLDEVRREWLGGRGRGLHQLRSLGLHSLIYQDVYGQEFMPQGILGVSYLAGPQVTWGDIVVAKDATAAPQVTLPSDPKHGYATLTLTNPDGHLQQQSQELLHWMM